MKRILITCTDVMMYQFILPHVQYLNEQGFIVDVACSHAEGYKKEGYHKFIRENIPDGSSFYPLNLERNPFSLVNRKGLKELKKIINGNTYDLIWTNEPVMSVMTRLAARKARRKGTKVLYMAHGYHFFKGAPKKNWLFYPVEKIMVSFCDAMCMICWEDYEFTRKHMPSKKVYHIDGIGFDVKKFSDVVIDREKKRSALGIDKDDVFILSVGELQARKNHEPAIRAIGSIDNPHLKYMICGRGELENHLREVARKVGMEGRLMLPGHVYDIPELLKAADIFVHPSQREGLGIAALEAMAAGLPLVTSNVQGIKDYVINGKTGFVTTPNDIEGYRKAILKLVNNPDLREYIQSNNKEIVKKYDISEAVRNVYSIIMEILGETK